MRETPSLLTAPGLPPPDDLTPSELEDREKAQGDFFFFAREVLGYTRSKLEWKEVVDGRQMKMSETRSGDLYGISRETPHKRIVDLLLSRQSNHKHIEAPRGSYKSTILRVFVLWLLIKNPNLRVSYLMWTKRQAKKFVNDIRKHLKPTSKLVRLWPHMTIESTDDDGSFYIQGRTDPEITDPSVEPGGAECDFTGSHYDLILMDDPVNFQNARSSDGIEKVRALFDFAMPLLDPGGLFIGCGTRYTDADLWGDILRDEQLGAGGEFECLVLGCGMELIKREDHTWDLEGEPIFPHLDERFLRTKLHSSEGGHYTFSTQYINKCLAADEQVFFREQFQPMRWKPWIETLPFYLLTDAAYSQKEKACYSVLAMVALDSVDNAYLAELQVGRWQPPEFCERLCLLWERWAMGRHARRDISPVAVRRVCMETDTASTVLKSQLDQKKLEMQLRFRVEPVRRGRTDPAKEQRILGSSGRFDRGGFYVLDTVAMHFYNGMKDVLLWDPDGHRLDDGRTLPAGELVDQFIRFPRGRFVDIPDALADLDARDQTDRRICVGSGQREDIRMHFKEMVGKTVTQQFGPRAQRNGGMRAGRGDRWSAIQGASGGR